MEVNQFVCYPGHGLAQITSIDQLGTGEFICLKIIDSGLKITIPMSSKDKFLRPLMSREIALKCQLYIRESSEYMPEDKMKLWNVRYRNMLDKLKSNNPIKIAEVFAELTNRKNDGEELSFGERKMRDTALSLLEPEIAMVLK